MLFMANSPIKTILPLLKALGNPVRLDILRLLIAGEQCVCAIFAHLDLPQNLVSHHLGILRKNHFIHARKEGKWVHYSLNPEQFLALKGFVEAFSTPNNLKTTC